MKCVFHCCADVFEDKYKRSDKNCLVCGDILKYARVFGCNDNTILRPQYRGKM